MQGDSSHIVAGPLEKSLPRAVGRDVRSAIQKRQQGPCTSPWLFAASIRDGDIGQANRTPWGNQGSAWCPGGRWRKALGQKFALGDCSNNPRANGQPGPRAPRSPNPPAQKCGRRPSSPPAQRRIDVLKVVEIGGQDWTRSQFFAGGNAARYARPALAHQGPSLSIRLRRRRWFRGFRGRPPAAQRLAIQAAHSMVKWALVFAARRAKSKHVSSRKRPVVMMCPPRFRVKAGQRQRIVQWGQGPQPGCGVRGMSNLEKGEGQGAQAGCP